MLPSSLPKQARRHVDRCVRQAHRNVVHSLRAQPLRSQRPFTITQRSYTTVNPLRRRSSPQELHAKYKRSIALSAAGMAACAVAMYVTIKLYFPEGLKEQQQDKDAQQAVNKEGGAVKLDASASFGGTDPIPLIIDGVEQVPTQNDTIPYFPKTIRIPSSLGSDTTGRKFGEEVRNESGKEDEYTLLGLGRRTVSFLGIQVYIVGMYIAKADIPALQQRLVRQAVSPSLSSLPEESAVAATSLVPVERDNLKSLLLDTEKGEEVWGQILKEGGIRTAFRIVPTRNTDFIHLRDGWVRAVTGRAQKANAQAKELAKKDPEAPPSEFADDSFGTAINEFKSLLGGGARKNVPKGQTLLLLRDRQGALDILHQPGDKKPTIWLGHVADERLSRLLWINYLAGKTVASESARKSIVEGVMGIVGRPIGTVE